MKEPRRVPVWMMVVIVLAALPVTAFPVLLSNATADGSDVRTYLWLYPAYVAVAAYLAWQCYGRRTEMSWIIIVLMLLTHAAIWLLVTTS